MLKARSCCYVDRDSCISAAEASVRGPAAQFEAGGQQPAAAAQRKRRQGQQGAPAFRKVRACCIIRHTHSVSSCQPVSPNTAYLSLGKAAAVPTALRAVKTSHPSQLKLLLNTHTMHMSVRACAQGAACAEPASGQAAAVPGINAGPARPAAGLSTVSTPAAAAEHQGRAGDQAAAVGRFLCLHWLGHVFCFQAGVAACACLQLELPTVGASCRKQLAQQQLVIILRIHY